MDLNSEGQCTFGAYVIPSGECKNLHMHSSLGSSETIYLLTLKSGASPKIVSGWGLATRITQHCLWWHHGDIIMYLNISGAFLHITNDAFLVGRGNHHGSWSELRVAVIIWVCVWGCARVWNNAWTLERGPIPALWWSCKELCKYMCSFARLLYTLYHKLWLLRSWY